MIILGIDPGYDRMGVAVVKKGPPKETLLYSTCLTSPKTAPFHERLLSIGREVRELIKKHAPNGIAIEKLFFAKNQKTASAISEVRGMLMFLSGDAGIPIYEYTPLQIKIAVAGYGKADKRQVETMVRALVQLQTKDRLDDEYDAIAIALTCIAHNPHRKSTG